VVVKPSEISEHSSAAMKELIDRYLDTNCIRVVLGGVPETTALLTQRWDHIMYTGNGTVGKIIMRAAAEHLTPVTLELGGKSPAVVDKDVDLAVAARRIAWGKFFNGGQTCTAPDYVLVHADIKDAFLEQLRTTIKNFYGDEPKNSPDYCRIINERHCQRLANLLEADRGKVFIGGQVIVPEKYIAPTVLVDVDPKSSPVMQDEIFGPLLPVITVASVHEAILFINSKPKPLALYVFSRSAGVQQEVLSRTSSGGACVNETIMHYNVPGLPFGGVGPSGMGAYHGEAGFKTFSHMRAVLNKTTWMDLSVRYPPYNEANLKGLEWMM